MLRLMLCQLTARTHMLTKPRRRPTAYDAELKKWREATKSAVSQLRKEFWQSQTEVEHKWMDTYTASLTEKIRKKTIKDKEMTIMLCKRTQEKLNYLSARAKRQAAQAEARRAHESAAKSSREHLISALNIDSQTWVTPQNYQQKLTEELILPHAFDYTDYYSDLKNEINAAVTGARKDSNMLWNNKNETVVRNTLLVPIFTDVKSLIKRLTYSEQTKLDMDYEVAKAVIRTEQRENAELLIKSLREKYVKLAAALSHAEFTPSAYIARAYQQTVWIQDLLVKWNEYMAIARLDDHQMLVYLNSPATEREEKKREEQVGAADLKQEETWDNDMQAANPEDSDEAPSEAIEPIPEVAKEKEKLQEESAEVNVEKFLDPFPEPSLDELNLKPEDMAVELDMYSGEDEVPKSRWFEEKVESDTRQVMEFMFESLDRQFGNPENLFESPSTVDDPKHLLQTPDNRVFNPSFVLDRVRKALHALRSEDLSESDRLKKSETLTALDAIEDIRVIEPRLLHRVFAYHRYDAPRFRLD